MGDIIERLRDPDIVGQWLEYEAADEIESLEDDANSLRNTITSIQLSLKERDAKIERLRAALKEAAKSLAEDEQEIERLRDAVKALLRERDYVMDYVYDPNLDEVHALVNEALAALEDDVE